MRTAWLCLLALLAGLPSRAQPPTAGTTEPAPPTHALWLQPLGMALGALSGTPRVLTGFNARVSPGVDLMGELEVGYGYSQSLGGCDKSGINLTGTLGLHLPQDPRRPLQGFFLQPKLLARLSQKGTVIEMMCPRDAVNDWALNYSNDERELGMGLDLGYQWTAGPVYVSTLLGAHLAYCFDCQEDVAGAINVGETRRTTSDGVVSDFVRLAFNFNLLRMGVAF